MDVGWFSDDAISASRWNRRRAAGSANWSDKNLMATGRFSLRVDTTIDLAHAAATQGRDDFICRLVPALSFTRHTAPGITPSCVPRSMPGCHRLVLFQAVAVLAT
jgi:hypothetical protein